MSLISYWYEDVLIHGKISSSCQKYLWPKEVGCGYLTPEIFFQYCIIKWSVLVDSDVLHVLLIVVTDM